MPRTMTISKARQQLTTLPERLAEDTETIAITRKGVPVLALIPWDLYESLVETLEILGDEPMVTALRRAVQEVEAGRGVEWAAAREQLRQ